MDTQRDTVVIGMLGNRLDAGKSENRWNRWRPSVAICQHEDLLVKRFELLHRTEDQAAAEMVRDDIAIVSPETQVQLTPVTMRDPWDFGEVFGALHEFARSYPFDTESEDYLVHMTTGTHVAQICLFLLTESRHLPGRILQTSPPPRMQSGIGTLRVIDLDLSKYDVLALRFAQERKEGTEFLKAGIATRNRHFNQLIERIEKVAIASSAPLLITGPTGAGKTQLARKIYELKRRRKQLDGRFVEVNCATLRGDQAMSALFGHAQGAFTGATTGREGLLKAADQGLLFLDEIAELGLDEQAMLLRAIEEKRFLPLGADSERESDFQLIAGTNTDLLKAVHQGEFREDLLARINLWSFALPGLNRRPEDISPNLDFELDQFGAKSGEKVSMNTEARSLFLRFAESPKALWKGSFRDLNAAVTRMATLARGGRITTEDVEEEIERLQRSWDPKESASGTTDVFPEEVGELDLFDQIQLQGVLKVCKRSRSLSEAGRELFAVSRREKSNPNDADRLRKYLGRFNLTFHQVQMLNSDL